MHVFQKRLGVAPAFFGTRLDELYEAPDRPGHPL
jgi:hypothetical protein